MAISIRGEDIQVVVDYQDGKMRVNGKNIRVKITDKKGKKGSSQGTERKEENQQSQQNEQY